MPIDSDLTAEIQARGLAPSDQGIYPDLQSEMQARNLQTGSNGNEIDMSKNISDFARNTIAPFQGMPQQLFNAGINAGRGVLLQPPTDEGRLSKLSNTIGQGAPPALAASMAAPFGAVLGAPAGLPGSMALGATAAGIGGMAGRGMQIAAKELLLGQETPETQASQDILKSGATQAAAQGITDTASLLAAPVKAAAKNLYDYFATSKMFGGIAQPAWTWFKGNVNKVFDMVGSSPEMADNIADDLRTAVSNSSQRLEDAYKAGINDLASNAKEPVRVSLSQDVLPKIKQIMDEGFGYLNPDRNAGTPEAAYVQKRVLDRLGKLDDVTPMRVFEFQKDLNGYIKDNVGTQLGAALQQVKGVVRNYINSTPSLAPISEMNEAWATAKDIDSMASKITNKNDLVSFLQQVFRNDRDTLAKQNINRLSQFVPEVGDAVNQARNYMSAQAISPLFRGGTGTGFETAGLLGLGAVLKGTGMAPAAIAAAALTSPKLYGLGYKYLSPIASGVGAALPAATVAGRAAAQGVLTNYAPSPTTPLGMERAIRDIHNSYKQ